MNSRSISRNVLILCFYEKFKIWVWMNNFLEIDVKKNWINIGYLNWFWLEKVLLFRIVKLKLN